MNGILKRTNPWLLAAIAFFIVVKFFFIAWMWHGRALPPEPDDTLIYSGYIYSVSDCPQLICNPPALSLSQPAGYHYFSYRVAWGALARLLHLSSVPILEVSFYIGTALLVVALCWFLRRWLPNRPTEQAVALAILALFAGQPGYHGFFWVVPSFFSVLLFFVLLGFLGDQKEPPYWWLVVFTILFVLVHPMSFYVLALFPLYAGFRYLLERTWRNVLYRSIVCILLVGFLTQVGVRVSIYLFSQPVDHVSNATTASQAPVAPVSFRFLPPAASLTAKAEVNTSLQRFHDDYLNWLAPHWSGFILFLFFVFLLWWYRSTVVLALLAASVLFTLLACALNPFGYRALIYLWPVTFLFYGLGFWSLFRFWQETILHRWWRYLLYGLTSVGLGSFVAANLLFSFLLADFMNQNHDIALPPTLIPYLILNTALKDPIVFDGKLLNAYSMNSPLANRVTTGPPKYVVIYFPPSQARSATHLDIFYAWATKFFTGRSIPEPVAPDESQPVTPQAPPGLSLERQFDDVFVYRNIYYQP